VLEAGDGAEALRAIRELGVDVVVTDILLADPGRSGLDGLALCRLLDEAPDLRKLPVLVMSGDTDSLAEARAYASDRPNRAVLPKPFNTRSLSQAIDILLEKTRR